MSIYTEEKPYGKSIHTGEEPYIYDFIIVKVSKGVKLRSRYNQVPHPTQVTNGKVTNSQLDTTNESQEFSPFPAGDHKAHINRCAQRHSKHKTEQKHKRSTKASLKNLVHKNNQLSNLLVKINYFGHRELLVQKVLLI